MTAAVGRAVPRTKAAEMPRATATTEESLLLNIMLARLRALGLLGVAQLRSTFV